MFLRNSKLLTRTQTRHLRVLRLSELNYCVCTKALKVAKFVSETNLRNRERERVLHHLILLYKTDMRVGIKRPP